MAIAVLFTPRSTLAEYQEIIRRLEATGAGAPAGRLYSVCYGTEDRVRVTDVWESSAAFEAFLPTLLPIVQQVGADPGQPEIVPVQNIIIGDARPAPRAHK